MAGQNTEGNIGNLRPPWRPGQSGNPGGRPKTKAFKNALEAELEEAGDDGPSLRKIARALIDKAATGDIQAIKELADRLDGKPMQLLEHSGPDGRPQLTKIVHEFVHVERSREEQQKQEPLLVEWKDVTKTNGNGNVS
jgi:hypothetical protein